MSPPPRTHHHHHHHCAEQDEEDENSPSHPSSDSEEIPISLDMSVDEIYKVIFTYWS